MNVLPLQDLNLYQSDINTPTVDPGKLKCFKIDVRLGLALLLDRASIGNVRTWSVSTCYHPLVTQGLLFSGVRHWLSQARVAREKVERGDKYRGTEERG